MTRALAYSTLGEARMDVETIIDRAGLAGAAAVELRVAAGEVLAPTSAPADAAAIGARLHAGGLAVLALCSYVPLAAELGDGAADTDLLHHLRLAEAAGAGGVRVFMKRPPERSPADGDLQAVQRLRRVLPDAPENVRVLVETHDSHATAASVRTFLDALPESIMDRVAVIWDTAHTWTAHESLDESATLLGPWLAHVQVKEIAGRDDPLPVDLGAGTFPVGELASALDRIGYDGAVSLEWEHTWHPELPDLADALTRLRRWAAPLFDGSDGHD